MDDSLDIAEPLLGQILIDRFMIGGKLGSGELGDVFAADDLFRQAISDDSRIAIKVMHQSLLDRHGGLKTIAPKLASGCRLSHPNLINVFDFYQDGETVFLAMERLQGGNLAKMFEQRSNKSPFEAEEAQAILIQIIETLIYLHATAPLFRLNPERVWLPSNGQRLKVSDLGLSSLVDGNIMRQSALASGQSLFMAPEVFSGEQLPDIRADQFSLGILALTLFCGSPRASIKDLSEVLGKTSAAPWIDHLPRLIAPDPERRFANLEEFKTALGTAPSPRSDAWNHRRPAHKIGIWQWKSLQISCLVTVLGFFAWLLGPRWLSKKRLATAANVEVHETRRSLSKLGDLRLELVSKSVASNAFGNSIKELANTKFDFELVEDLTQGAMELEQGLTDSASLRIANVRSTLNDRLKRFAAASSAIDAIERLKDLRKTVLELDTGKDLLATIEQSKQDADQAFENGAFITSHTLAQQAGEEVEKEVATAIGAIRAEALQAQEHWFETLNKLGDFPPIEPISEPAEALALGERLLTEDDQVAAFDRFKTARDGYRFWTRGLDLSTPNLETSEFPPPRKVRRMYLQSVFEGYRTWIREMETERLTDESGRNSKPAEKRQEWAIPEEGTFTNSLGMIFVPVQDLMACVWETRLIDFLAFTQVSGTDAAYLWRDTAMYFRQGPRHPVANITFSDSVRFCQWLTDRDRARGLIRPDQIFRIPSDLEWSQLAGLKEDPDKDPHERSFDNPGHYPWGQETERRAHSGNYYTWLNRDDHFHAKAAQDHFLTTAPVGSFPPNTFGIFDLGGNVWEWTADAQYGPEEDESSKAIRGGSWLTVSLETMRTAARDEEVGRGMEIGFRVVLAQVGTNRPKDSAADLVP